MKNLSSAARSTQNGLLFMPDISGFTRFVTETEISHAQHIIQELLKILVDSNTTGLEVNEIEGDAILFYRMGKMLSMPELTTQISQMFNRFHLHIRQYERNRICQCGACCTANKLSLKFVAHYGEIAINTIRQHKKLFGKEVITVHRLLKNDIPFDDYALFTKELMSACPTWGNLSRWLEKPVMYSAQTYDAGRVDFSYTTLQPLLDHLKDPPMVDFSIPGYTVPVLETRAIVNAPLDEVFNVIADIQWRVKWIPGTLPDVTDLNTVMVQQGQTHRCLAKGPVIVSHDYLITEDAITFSETMMDKKYSVVYRLQKTDEHTTSLTATGYMKRNFLMTTMFRLFMKSKLTALYGQAWDNLKTYIDSLRDSQRQHPYRVITRIEANVAA